MANLHETMKRFGFPRMESLDVFGKKGEKEVVAVAATVVIVVEDDGEKEAERCSE